VPEKTTPETKMQEIQISGDNHVREQAVRRTVLRLKQRFGEIDDLALEAHLMLELTHGVLANMRETQWTRSGVTGRRVPLLRLLYLAEGNRLNMGTIAANLGIGTNNTTQLIDGMVRDGLVTRTTDSQDKRVIYAVLTDHGRALFADFFPKNAERIRNAWAPLSDDEKIQLVSLLARLRINLLAVEADSQGFEEVEPDAGAAPTEEPSTPRRLPSVTRMSQPDN
jgi:MarR family transcriptional regulator, 2-MHQ and catechol-resistance regulon repressor